MIIKNSSIVNKFGHFIYFLDLKILENQKT